MHIFVVTHIICYSCAHDRVAFKQLFRMWCPPTNIIMVCGHIYNICIAYTLLILIVLISNVPISIAAILIVQIFFVPISFAPVSIGPILILLNNNLDNIECANINQANIGGGKLVFGEGRILCCAHSRICKNTVMARV